MNPVFYFTVGFGIWAFVAGVVIFFLMRQRNSSRSKLATVEAAYGELVRGSVDRERALSAEAAKAGRKEDEAIAGWSKCAEALKESRRRMALAEQDADMLAPIVREYVRICDETAALLKDETPATMTAEREALRLHDEAVKLRISHETK